MRQSRLYRLSGKAGKAGIGGESRAATPAEMPRALLRYPDHSPDNCGGTARRRLNGKQLPEIVDAPRPFRLPGRWVDVRLPHLFTLAVRRDLGLAVTNVPETSARAPGCLARLMAGSGQAFRREQGPGSTIKGMNAAQQTNRLMKQSVKHKGRKTHGDT